MKLNNGKVSRASSPKNWQEYYDSREQVNYAGLININDFRHYPHKLLIDLIGQYIDGKKNIIEIGAGDSNLLVELAQRFAVEQCYGLDYLEEGCARLRNKAKQANIDVKVVCADMFQPPDDFLGRFDFVMSFGVVEHFYNLAEVMRAISRFSNKDGIIFTLIPNNKKTVYGWLMRKWNIDVYNAHVMYDMNDLLEAHRAAGLEIITCRYLASSNFGMLSWCFKDGKRGINFWIYKQLTRISKLIWFMESRFGQLKPVRMFSPYIVCISRLA